ncbi:MAG: hypothetical protein ACRDY3_02445 [Acidimicrobiales bacterium]
MPQGPAETLGTALDRLRAEAGAFAADPYLVTVTPDGRPHCGVVTVGWDGSEGRVLVRAPSGWEASAAAGHRQVTLLWPPDQPGGYSLIVDGLVEGAASAAVAPGADRMIAVAPRRAVLHRRGRATGPESACGSDCVPILTR